DCRIPRFAKKISHSRWNLPELLNIIHCYINHGSGNAERADGLTEKEIIFKIDMKEGGVNNETMDAQSSSALQRRL
ncbi:MAG: hypothetical protein WC552_10090, partial [Candidatus Omnitrophota bacterium]